MQIKRPTLTWKEAPDIINPYHLANILGIGENKAREIFNSQGFPRIKYIGVKSAARLWCMGIQVTPEVVKDILKKESKWVKGVRYVNEEKSQGKPILF